MNARLASLATLAFLSLPASAQTADGMPSLRLGLDWEQRYDHGIAGHDSLRAVEVDSDGNVLTAGSSLGTWFSWRTEYTYEIVTLKYSRAGALLWERRYDSPGHGGFDDVATDVLVRPDDSIVVLGQGQMIAGDQDMVLLCYDALGNELWQHHWSNGWNDGATALALAPDGSLYALGSSAYGANVTDIVLVKYSAAGELQWARNWHGGGGTDYGVGLGVDPSGNVTIGGTSIAPGPVSNYDWVALEYDADGNLLWSSRQASPANGWDYCDALHVDARGDVLLSGHLSGAFSTIKIDGAGGWLWTRSLGAGRGKVITSDAAGNLFVAGGGTVVSYLTDGTQRWTRNFVAPNGGVGDATALALDDLGRLVVSGSYFNPSGPQSQFLLAAFGRGGRVLDLVEHGGPESDSAAPGGLAVGARGAVFVTGSSPNGHDNDGLLLRF